MIFFTSTNATISYLNTKDYSRNKVHITDTAIELTDEEGSKNYVFNIEMPVNANEEGILSLAKYKSSIKSAH